MNFTAMNKVIGINILSSYRNFPQKIPVSNVIAINLAKEQGANVLSRQRNLPF